MTAMDDALQKYAMTANHGYAPSAGKIAACEYMWKAAIEAVMELPTYPAPLIDNRGMKKITDIERLLK